MLCCQDDAKTKVWPADTEMMEKSDGCVLEPSVFDVELSTDFQSQRGWRNVWQLATTRMVGVTTRLMICAGGHSFAVACRSPCRLKLNQEGGE